MESPHELSLKNIPEERQVGGEAEYHGGLDLHLQKQIHKNARTSDTVSPVHRRSNGHSKKERRIAALVIL